MPKMKSNPRYNVLSCRVSDELKESVDHALGTQTRQDFLHRAIMEKLIRDRQEKIDQRLRGINVPL